MGVYLRNSLKAGPFRFNLSQSGIGVSVGVPGFRVGTRPRGNYVRVGTRGVSYRATLASRPAGSRNVPIPPAGPRSWNPGSPSTLPGSVAVQEIPTATIEELQGSDPSEFIEQLQTAAQRHSIWPWAAALAVLVSVPLLMLPMLILGPLVYWLYQRDRAAQRIVAFYDFESQPGEQFAQLIDAAEEIRRSQRNWAITGSGAVVTTTQHKMNSGASAIVKRQPTTVNMDGPRELVTNIAVPSFQCGAHTLYLLPDRVLVKHRRSFADVSYRELFVVMNDLRFHESGSVPRDSQQVGTTWQYVNVKGGPDRRFKNNPQLRIMLYGRINFTTHTGLNLKWDCSRPVSARQFTQAVSSYGAPPELPSQ
ncbi:DUF4236 domain-containing protein [Kitasatospora sp. CM 4170]|uniref:DUF4236 domain-containing protein n=1 Tax=Kitasatospora aburaviensis TaxID=67265 RepID=A0ABW1F9Y1_9ACTN|nr:DUF4236 domain-containing protein [Kitasatospora sp. CM 4170]WNM46623.1 DUF4236 domain-containing protein [Kitasatospora sp. CM 4170]